MPIDHALAEEGDGRNVLERRRGHPGRTEAVAGETEHDEVIAAEMNGTEEPGVGVRYRLELLRRDLVPEDVRDARQIRAAVQKPPILRERESVGHAARKLERGNRGDLASSRLEQRRGGQD